METRGRRRDFATFVAARAGALYRTAFLLVEDAERAQCLVHETLVRSYVAWPRLPLEEAESAARRDLVRRVLAEADEGARAARTGTPGASAHVAVAERAAVAMHLFEHQPSLPGSRAAHERLVELVDAVEVPVVDVERVRSEGRARVARRALRRCAAAMGLLLLAGALVVSDPVSPGAGPLPDGPPASSGLPVREPAYARGRVLHVGPRSVTLPARVVEVDPTDRGAVVVTFDRRVWSTDGTGVRRIGRAWSTRAARRTKRRVAVGSSGDGVAWFEQHNSGPLTLVVYDAALGRFVRHVPLTTGSHRVAFPSIVSDDDVFLEPARPGDSTTPDAWRVDLSTGVESSVSSALS